MRRAEAAQIKHDGYEPILTKSRWCLLKRRENLTDNQEIKLKELLEYNLLSTTSRASGLICSASSSKCSGTS